MDISEQLFLYNESTVYLLNWEPAIAWLGEKRIVNFLPLGNCDAVDSVVLRNQLVVIYPYYINKCNLNLDKIKRENKIIIK
jgi:hypothetical protein